MIELIVADREPWSTAGKEKLFTGQWRKKNDKSKKKARRTSYSEVNGTMPLAPNVNVELRDHVDRLRNCLSDTEGRRRANVQTVIEAH